MQNERQIVREMLKSGVYDQNVIFKTIYPTYMGHYSTLRRIISEEKERGIN